MNRDVRRYLAISIFLLCAGATLRPSLACADGRIANGSVHLGTDVTSGEDVPRVERLMADHPSEPSLDPLLTLDGDSRRISEKGVSLLIATQKTGMPRSTDIPRKARELRLRSIARLIMQRVMDDANFVNKTRSLAARMKDLKKFHGSPETASVADGAQFLEALEAASHRGPLANVVIFGHAAPSALYMIEDRGFYATVAEVAKATRLARGTDNERTEGLRAMGARDLGDLERLIAHGRIRFAADAVIVFAGCEVAGSEGIDHLGIASRIADITGATVVASVGATDQSMAARRGALPTMEYSRGTWVRFGRGAKPVKLTSRWLDPLKELRLDNVRTAIPPQSDNAASAGDIPNFQRFRCAAHDASAAKIDGLMACGIQTQQDAVAAHRRIEKITVVLLDLGRESAEHLFGD
jgi:hypothetical protein